MDTFNATYWDNGKPKTSVTHARVIDHGRLIGGRTSGSTSTWPTRTSLVLPGELRVGPLWWSRSFDTRGRAGFDGPVIFFGDPNPRPWRAQGPCQPAGRAGGRTDVLFPPDAVDSGGQAHALSADLRNSEADIRLLQGRSPGQPNRTVYDLDVSSMEQIWTGGSLEGHERGSARRVQGGLPVVMRYTTLQVTDAPGPAHHLRVIRAGCSAAS